MRVLLIRPDSPYLLSFPPVGLGCIAHALRQARNDAIQILDIHLLKPSAIELAARIRDFAPHVVGITSMDCGRAALPALTALVKREAPAAKVVLGGPMVSGIPHLALSDQNVDVAVVGEGEVTVVELFNALDGGGDLSAVDGLVFRQDGKKVQTPPRKPLEDMDQVHMAWDLVDPFAYFSKYRAGVTRVRRDFRTLPLITSRGCPHGCIFCHSIFGKKFRAMSPDAVMAEIHLLRERFGVRQLEIMDDSFLLDRGRAEEILDRIAREAPGLSLSFPVGLRIDQMDEDILSRMAAAGAFYLSFPVESASPRIQKVIRKNLDLSRVHPMIRAALKKGFQINGFFILGFPGETYEEMMQTVDFACKTDLHTAHFFYLNPYPGTEAHRMSGLPENTAFAGEFHQLPPNVSAATDKELARAARLGYRKFYLNPARLARAAWKFPKSMNLFPILTTLVKILLADDHL